MKKIFLYLSFSFLILLLTGYPTHDPDSQITISGQYLDHKGNPIPDATVKYLQAGQEAGSGITDEEGNFLFQATLVGFKPIATECKDNFQILGPNPFMQETKFKADIEEEGLLRIFNMQGRLVAQQNLQAGSYEIIWGGAGRTPGISLANLQTRSISKTIRIIQQQSGSKGLEVRLISNDPERNDYKSISTTDDSITFARENTTFVSIPAFGHDSNFIQTGNIGPIITEYIQSVTAEIGDTLEWNIFDYHYNDDLTELSTTIAGATIVGDSVYQYAATEAGIYPQQVKLQDPEDITLSKSLSWTVYVDQQLIPPTANNDFYELVEDQGEHPGEVTANDNDPDGVIEGVEIVTPPKNGEAQVMSLIIKYLSSQDYNGLDSLQYRITDNDGLSDSAWVHYNIAADNDAPFATNPFSNVYNILEDDSLMITVWESHYSDIDSYPLSFSINNLLNAQGSQPNNDQVKIKPNPNWNGTITNVMVDAFDGEYTATSNGFSVEVESVNDYPNINDDQASTPYNTSVVIDVLANDSDVLDPDGGLNPASVSVIEQPIVGQITGINSGTGEITYEPPAGFSGQVSFVYEVYDNGVPLPALSGQATVVVTVGQGNLKPVANDDADAALEDVAKETDVLANDNDPDGNLLPSTVEIVQQPGNGTILNIDLETGAITYKGSLNWNGADIYKYRVGDDGSPQLWDTATVTMTVTAVNDAPYEVTPIQTQTINEDSIWEYTVRPTNVDDVDSPTLSYTLENVVNATWQANGDTLKVTPNDNWYGTITGIVVKASDGEYITSLTPFNLLVNSVNDPPVAADDAATVDEGQTVDIDVVANDTDPLDPAGSIDPTTVETNGLMQPQHGQVTFIDPVTGEITYEANEVTGTDPVIDTFEYRVADDGGLYDTAQVVMTINQVWKTYFKIIDIMTDTLLTNSTLHIGSDTYNLTSGDTTIAITPGTYEVNATHPNTIDWTSIWEEYLAIQRPGQLSNVEQRARDDYTSTVTFTEANDTLYLYKVMNDFNMYTVGGIIGSGVNGMTHRFSDNDLEAPAWFDLNYTAPTQSTRDVVQYWLQELIPATKGRLNMQYEEDDTQPETPYLQMAIDQSFNASNNTFMNGNIIDWCYARWPHNGQGWYGFGIEMLQAVGDLNDISGNDPPILSYDFETGQWIINHTGQECFHLLYNFNPGTRF